MKKSLSVLLVAIMLLCLIPTTAFAVKEQSITIISVNDILDPLDGNKPDLSATSAAPTKYTVKSLFWSEYDEDFEWIRDLEADDRYVMGNYYFVFVTLEAREGYSFPSASSITASVNGDKANKYSPQNDGKTIQIYYCFEKCKKNIARVDLTIVNPVVGKTPTFGRVKTDEYESKNTSGVSNQTNGVTWTNQASGVNLTISNPFKADCKYTVKYYLSAKENYWFNGTKYYINGKQVSVLASNAGMTEVVVGLTDLVPGDGKTGLDSLNLTVTAPADGAKPDYTKIDGTGYYSDNGINGSSTRIYKNGIAWYKTASSYFSPGTTETFVAGTDYTVKIALTAKDKYKFADNISVKINGKTATVERFDDGSINVSVVLSAPKKEHTHTPSGWQSDDMDHWKICTDSSCGALIGEKKMHTNSDPDGKCDVCGYQLPIEVPEEPDVTTPTEKPTESTKPTEEPTEPTEEPTEPTEEPDEPTSSATEPSTTKPTQSTPTDDQADDGDSNLIIWILVGALVGITAGVGITFVVVKKKSAK